MRGKSPRLRLSRPLSPSTLAARSAQPAGPAPPAIPPLIVPLVAGPYQNNGATQWYARIGIGTPPQWLKIALDTGCNFIWSTSSLCGPDSCQHYGGGRFVYQDSSSFQWVDRQRQPVDFGPWGSMVVETGNDTFTFDPRAATPFDFFLSADYSGSQFEQLDWDGGIGIPSASAFVDPSVSFSIASLMSAGLMDPQMPFVSFSMDPRDQTGRVILGGFDPDAFDASSGLFLPWTPYTAFPDVEYIWTTPLNRYTVGDEVVAVNRVFCLDSGSSQFKGDDYIMNMTLDLVATPPYPDVKLDLGSTADGALGRIVVPPDIYRVLIQAGPQEGEVLPQFNPLGLDELVLVGSVLMEHLYTIYHYAVTQDGDTYDLNPIGMWIFNRTDGPRLIQTTSNRPVALSRQPVRQRQQGGTR